MFNEQDLEALFGPEFDKTGDSDLFMPGGVLRHKDNGRRLCIRGGVLCYKDNGEPISNDDSMPHRFAKFIGLDVLTVEGMVIAFLLALAVGVMVGMAL